MGVRLGRLRMLTRNDEGSVTLEASMVFPWVLIITFLLILFSIVLTQHVLQYYSATVTGERSAFDWSNSAKEVRTGAYPSGRYDGLYWRIQDDSLLAGLFGWTINQDGVKVPISLESAGNGGSSAEDKLRKAAGTLPEGIGGEIGYRNQLWKREISVVATGGQIPVPLRRIRGGEGRAGSANVMAVVVEPAEMIRTFDLIRYYRAKINQKGDGAASYRAKAADILKRWR
jgi:hypothetical protein